MMIMGAELSVRAAVVLAALLKTRPLFLGLTVVALGSSAPQMAVGLQAALTDSTDIAVGSVIGSNIFNILVTLGLSALIIPLRVARQMVRVDLPLMIGATALVKTAEWMQQAGFHHHDIAIVHGLATLEIVVASVIVGYVALRYLGFYLGSWRLAAGAA